MRESYFFDSPVVLDCTVTSIPGSGSSTLQVIAKLTDQITRVLINDAVGQYVGIYSGAAGAEILKAIISGGKTYEAPVIIAAGSRVSLRNMDTAAITTGSLCVTFIAGRDGSL